ncbi:hypothetical protein [Phyllobacterium sp. NPDC097923]|uniref:hypothetical protein n=1 Tax=unclassified Phyllobacterium TaxID=2638441 RepID=UPI001AD17886|nr:hypothetical protein [Phyllobacterium sp.]
MLAASRLLVSRAFVHDAASRHRGVEADCGTGPDRPGEYFILVISWYKVLRKKVLLEFQFFRSRRFGGILRKNIRSPMTSLGWMGLGSFRQHDPCWLLGRMQ